MKNTFLQTRFTFLDGSKITMYMIHTLQTENLDIFTFCLVEDCSSSCKILQIIDYLKVILY